MSDLQEYLNEIKGNTFKDCYLLLREILLQSMEMKLIELPAGFIEGDAHRIPLSSIVFLPPPVQNKHQKCNKGELVTSHSN